jgi:hypothetical protein
MAIDYDAILDKFILVAQEALPTELSLIGVSGTLPAVIRSRQDGAKPDYPYATIDVLDTIDESGWLYSETINSNDETVYETNKQLLLNYRVYGGNAVNIAQKLHGFFRLNRVLGDIISTTGGSVVTVDDVDQSPILLADTYLESATFNITFNITDTFVDTAGSDSFTTVHLDGTIFDISTDDPNPLDVDIIVPTP